MTRHIALAENCERLLREIADSGPLSIDDLVAKTGYPSLDVNAALCQLHLTGRVAPVSIRRGRRNVTCYAAKGKP